MEGKIQIFPIYPSPGHLRGFPDYPHLQREWYESDTFVTTEEPSLTHHHHTESREFTLWFLALFILWA